MNTQSTEDRRKALLQEKEDLLKKIDEFSKVHDFGDDVDSGDEKTDEAEELFNQSGEVKAFHDRIEEIQTELDSMES